MTVCNTSLISIGDEAVNHEVPIMGSLTFHHIGLLVTAAFALAATLIALALIFFHATHYSRPHQQRHIIRILFMIPVYAVISFVSYMYFRHALYWEVLRDCYEAFAIASFFTLLCAYLERDLHGQKDVFRELGGVSGRYRLKNWVWPVTWMQKCTGGKEKGFLRVPRSGLTWFNILYVGVYQYCIIRVVFTFVAMITQFFDRYCESSLSPAFSHVWVMGFEALSVTIAMYCLIQFYVQLKDELAEHKPFLKILCIKLVIFFSFWQSIVISFISSSATPGGALLKPSPRIAYPDIKVGIPSMLLSIEMTIFAVIHIFAFSWKPYDISKNSDPAVHYQGGMLGWKAIWDAFNLWDIVKAAARGMKWLVHGRRFREGDISYERSRQGTGKAGMGSEADVAYHGFSGSANADTNVQRNYDPYATAEEQEMGVMKGSNQTAHSEGRQQPQLSRTISDDSEDYQGLLKHAQTPAATESRETKKKYKPPTKGLSHGFDDRAPFE